MKRQTTELRKLKKQEIEQLQARFEASARQGDNPRYQALHTALQVGTRVDLPLGELANPEMSGFVMVWSMTRPFIHGEITDQHQFNAQGLEGLVSIEDVPLSMALLAAGRTGIYRIEIFVPRNWYRDFYKGRDESQDEVREEEEA